MTGPDTSTSLGGQPGEVEQGFGNFTDNILAARDVMTIGNVFRIVIRVPDLSVFILVNQRFLRQIQRGQLLLFEAFGAGFTWGATLLRWTVGA